MYEFAHTRRLINVEEPGGLLDEIENGGISAYQFYQWARFYRLRADRMRDGNGYRSDVGRGASRRSPRRMMDDLKKSFDF